MSVLSQIQHGDRFHASHAVHFTTSVEQVVVILTGTAIPYQDEVVSRAEDRRWKLDGSGWMRDELTLELRFPDIIPFGKAFVVDQIAPFITLNAVTHASNGAGWAVDGFWRSHSLGPIIHAPTPQDPAKISFVAAIAAHSEHSTLIRLGYSLTVLGRLIDAPQ